MTTSTLVPPLSVFSLSVLSLALAADTATGGQASRFFDNPTEYEFFPILFAFAFFGACAHLLVTWRVDMLWPHRIGYLMSGVFAGFLFALLGWGRVPPAINMFMAGVAAYWGDMALIYLARKQYGELPPAPPPDDGGCDD